MQVRLESRGNPDFNQDPDRPVWGAEDQTVEVNSLKEASEVCREYCNRHDLGGGSWTGGEITEDGKVIGHVSFNGRVWDRNPWTSGAKELAI